MRLEDTKQKILSKAPVLTLIGVCGRQPEQEGECLQKLQAMSGSFSVWSTAANNKCHPRSARRKDAALTTLFRGRRCAFCAAAQKNF